MIRRTFLTLACVAVLLAGCSAAPSGQRQGQPAATTVTVFAAASLGEVFEAAATGFEATHPDVDLRFSFESSSALVDQLKGGAPADVLATADTRTMTNAQTAALIAGEPTVFATNVLTLIVPRGNPAGVTGFDASLQGTAFVICADGVPCGTATRALAQRLGVELSPVSEELKVTDVRGKVASGEADAGVVYTTDARAVADKVAAIAIPGADADPNRYPIAVLADARHPEQARAFVDYILSAEGRTILAESGFGAP